MSYVCKRCNYASNFVTDLSSGEVFCPHCGVVIFNKIPAKKLIVDIQISLLTL
ncbi:MAG: hypothetical protein D4R90_05575 [Nitrosopumilales archaeon]|nr:MAG: hypothetical protein D4R90_05575 [Nitrosopumilales archaeon]